MAVPTSPPGRRPRLADRLAAARRRRFVGREAELALFAAALADPEPPFALVYVHGPGGVGKTVLLGEFARLAEEAGVPAVRLDGRDLDPSPPGFLAALGRALHEPPDASPLEALARRPRGVLMVDTYETLGPLDAWLRETLLPELPGGHLVVLAGRDRPAAGWLADAGWRDLIRVVPLRNLRPAESQAYLSARGVPAAQHPAVLSFTHSHPLALSLVADVAASGGDPTALAPSSGRTWSGRYWGGSWSSSPGPATARPSSLRPCPGDHRGAAGLGRRGPARTGLAGLRGGQRPARPRARGRLDPVRFDEAVVDFAAFRIERHQMTSLLGHMLDLTVCDAAYLVLAQALEAPVVSADAKLGEATRLGIRVQPFS